MMMSKADHRFRVYENMVLRRTYGPNKEKITGKQKDITQRRGSQL
jgi:hypothetical protein